MNYFQKQLLWILVYAISMAMLEAAVVIYLRFLFYPDPQLLFPIQPMPALIIRVEVFREIATLLMLAGIAFVSAKSFWSRFGVFLLSFGIWDIFYYVFLKVFLNWPAGLLDWDVLFLLPVPWFGPVITPCLIAMLMVFWGGLLFYHERHPQYLAPNRYETALLLSGTAMALAAFMWDAISLLFRGDVQWNEPNMLGDMPQFIPEQFQWPVFLIGYLLMCLGVLLQTRRLRLYGSLVV
ncbi:MAG: hypothetical protein EP332_06805 [Bacteroidetes bacterium]|nr:MAG: hypothetical protein EP332_06805 [Bacteroidota bacterium]